MEQIIEMISGPLPIVVYIFIFAMAIPLYALFFVLLIWFIAHTDKFFAFIREGEGIVVVRGESAHKFIISFRGHHLEWDDELKAEKIVDGDPERHGFLGFLEKRFGIYWMGIWPFTRRHKYLFRWKEWDPSKEGYYLWTRSVPTDFFFVKTFKYGSKLQAAEAIGNVAVDVKFSLFVKIIYPEIAIFRNEDWFGQLDDYALRCARIYVGNRTFNELRTEAKEEGAGSRTTFSTEILKINDKISTKERGGVLDRLGVQIVSAQIIEVDIAGTEEEKQRLHNATTERFVKEQEGEGIRAIGDANAYAITAEGTAIQNLGEVGMHLRRQQAIEEAGRQGNTVVFSDDNEKSSGLTDKKIAGLVTEPLSRALKSRNKGGA